VVAALYRRYRPETFAELIGQSQVTDPLRTALRTDRVNHAYLFSGPRGCGKTTSARILARCLNCAEGPTDTPCGVCPSCIELSRDGGGSLDVVEIDAASHNGVDDARDLRERAVFAPARDRFKIFILDEAHMVTPQGFNALLKIVEEPPEHVKFIFATTEPEKVIGTIRSRTHHYPFRLVPPAQMLDYVQQMCASESVEVEPGVLPLVVRAGGGSVRDTLSLLDQLIAGSDPSTNSGTVTLEYERAVALLGYTHGALLDEVVDALGARDAAAVFGSVDRVIQTGQDPRRFVEDLLERLRDLIVVAATSGNAASVLRGVPQDQLDRMAQQASAFGTAELSRAADVVNSALTEMTGATSPRLHLELMVARILVPASDDSERGALARVERLERRVGVESPAPAVEPGGRAGRDPVVEPVETAPPAAVSVVEPVETSRPAASVTLEQFRNAWPEILERVQKAKMSAWTVVYTAQARALEGDVLTLSFVSQNDVDTFRQPQGAGEGVSEYLRTAIVDVLGLRVKFIARSDGAQAAPVEEARQAEPVESSPRDLAPDVEPPIEPTPSAPHDVAPQEFVSEPDDLPPDPGESWAVVAIPTSDPVVEAPSTPRGTARSKAAAAKAAASSPTAPVGGASPSADATPSVEAAPSESRPVSKAHAGRYGESVVRELLQANFIEEQPIASRVVPVPRDE
jgi:DNA polymerase-3 subunit gamma/tau